MTLLEVAPSTGAGIVTAAATLVTAIGGVILAVGVLIPILRNTRKTAEKVDSTAERVEVVHTIVNQQRTDAQRYNIALTELLRKNGIEVPIDQSLPVTNQPDAAPGQPA